MKGSELLIAGIVLVLSIAGIVYLTTRNDESNLPIVTDSETEGMDTASNAETAVPLPVEDGVELPPEPEGAVPENIVESTGGTSGNLDSLLEKLTAPGESTTVEPDEKDETAQEEDETQYEEDRDGTTVPGRVSVNEVIAREYVVKKGDTLSSIAMSQLGSYKFAKLILQRNPEVIPERLAVGVKLVMPEREKVLALAEEINQDAKLPEGIGKDEWYRVQKGDSLYKIAQEQLGDGARFREIIKLNPDVNPQLLRPGQILRMPKK